MSRKGNSLGQAWFYHAPSKPDTSKERVGYPPMSQIPGLSDLSHLPEEPQQRYWINESDSNYVRLAKQGGRQDLLAMRPTKPHSEVPVGYPRCEWFYDNAPANDNKQQESDEPYQFMVPDYMVQQPLTKKSPDTVNANFSPEKTPYACDQKTAYEREGGGLTDKTVRLQEDKIFGYGTRLENKNSNKNLCKNKSNKSRSNNVQSMSFKAR